MKDLQLALYDGFLDPVCGTCSQILQGRIRVMQSPLRQRESPPVAVVWIFIE